MQTEHKFNINNNGQLITVIKQEGDKYSLEYEGQTMNLEYRPDNEGADHWLNTATNQEDEETKKLGALIKEYLRQIDEE